jgi:hypothetical protein
VSDKVDLWALSDLATPWCLRVAVTLGVAEHLARGTTKIDDLAREADCDADSLARVLRHLVGKGVFEEPVDGEFALNEPARVLVDPGPVRGNLDLDGWGGRVAGVWSGLLSTVRTGRPSYQEVYGRPYWEDLDTEPGLAASYDAQMSNGGRDVPDPAALVGDDWADVHHVVDVGGGAGAMLAQTLRAHPHLRGTLVDLPRTVARSGEIFESAGVRDRVTVSGQSFFDPLPRGADVYLLTRLLLDWPDEQAATLLTRCAEAAAPHGRVVVDGGVSPGGAPPKGGLMVMMLTGGRTRNLDQFGALAAKAGLAVTASGNAPSGRYIVECRPA